MLSEAIAFEYWYSILAKSETGLSFQKNTKK